MLAGYHSESRLFMGGRRPQTGPPLVVQVTPGGRVLYCDASIAESRCEATFGEMRDLCLAIIGAVGTFVFFSFLALSVKLPLADDVRVGRKLAREDDRQ